MVGHVIDFTPAGEVQAMHNDKFPLGFLGRQEIHRATEIKFNEETQTWSLCYPNDDSAIPLSYPPELCEGFKSYEGARQVEVAWLNACRLEGVGRNSTEGLAALKFIRGITPNLPAL